MTHRMKNTHRPGNNHENYTEFLSHNCAIVQGLTDGYESVICHTYKQHHLTPNKTMKKEYLGHASLKGDCFVFHKEVYKHLRCGKIRLADINERKMTEQEVHRRVQVGVRQNNNNNQNISQN